MKSGGGRRVVTVVRGSRGQGEKIKIRENATNQGAGRVTHPPSGPAAAIHRQRKGARATDTPEQKPLVGKRKKGAIKGRWARGGVVRVVV